MSLRFDDEGERDDAPPPWLADALDAAPLPPPRAEFRARLRERLLAEAAAHESASGAAGGESPNEARDARAAPRRSRSERGARPRSTRGRRWAWSALLVAASAAALALYFTAPTDRPRIELVESSLSEVRIDSERLADEAFLERALAGARIQVGDAPLRLRLDDVALLELAPRTEVTLHLWSEDGSGEARVDLARGGVRVATSPDFAPRRLSVRAPDAEVRVVGTEFGVDVVEAVGTCVCCTKGEVAVSPRGRQGVERVLAGGMAFCFSSGEAPMLGEVKPDHSADVIALRRYSWR